MIFLPLPSPSMSFLFHVSLILILLLIGIPPSLTYEPGYWYNNCSKGFNCGTQLKDISYPFGGGDGYYSCGHPDFQLNCTNADFATIKIMNVTYRVIEIDHDSDQTLKIARDDYYVSGGVCTPPAQNYNSNVDPTLYEYGSGYSNVTILYGCPAFPTGGFNVSSCPANSLSNPGVYVLNGSHGPGLCKTSIVVPVETDFVKAGKYAGLDQVLKIGFELKWKVDRKDEACGDCTKSGGKCGSDLVTNRATCFCPDQIFGFENCHFPLPGPPPAIRPAAIPEPTHTPRPGKNSVALPLGIGVGGAAIVGLFLGFLFFYVRQRKKQHVALSKSKDLSTPPSSKGLTTPTTKFSSTTPSYFSSQSTDLEKGGSTYFGVQVFSYTELEEATNNFDSARELGDGGFGTVYYGNLQDGRVVAVKRLYEKNFRRVEQFMNEVEILTRLRHPNLVLLYGCTSRRSRELLLVYEYIPNGTVADHLHGKKSESGLLTWPIRLSIAIETADALAYLHRSDIIHRDVKTNNILLDDNFQVKVADFGLSRLFPTDCTHVSTAPQGTPGYVDPEYYQCYQLTDKSDVYSFGVVLVELISSLEAVDTNRHRHDINLSNMAVSKIQNQALHELVDPSLGFETDSGVRRMTTMVAELAFRCLQQERDMRPSMVEVLEILKGIEKEEFGESKAEVVDIRSDDVGLLKNVLPPPFSPDSVVTDKWVSSSTPPSSF